MNASTVTHRPGLAYQYAFDWLAVHLHTVSHFVLCGDALPFQHTELVQRGLVNYQLTQQDNSPDASNLVCIEPKQTDLVQLKACLDNRAAPAQAHFIIAGPLSRFLSEHKTTKRDLHFINEKRIKTLLRQAGWVVTDRFGLHGISAIAAHLASAGSAQLKQARWQDRFHYKMRASFTDTGKAVALVCLAATYDA